MPSPWLMRELRRYAADDYAREQRDAKYRAIDASLDALHEQIARDAAAFRAARRRDE